MAYDTTCYDLAVYWLDEHEAEGVRRALAQEIQDTIENFIAGLEADKRRDERRDWEVGEQT